MTDLDEGCKPARARLQSRCKDAAGRSCPNQMEAIMTAVDRFLDAIRAGDVSACDAWAEGVTLDATVPNWRFKLSAIAAVRAEYGRWFSHPAELAELRHIPFEGGAVIEYVLTWQEDGVPHAAHHVHLLDVRDDLIVSDTVMCGGRWPASLLAEMGLAEMGLADASAG